ncbi:homoserine O-acetyltransferase MetX [Halothermothrix orenii]|uniref:Homoserine O-acetyltransferase n=1 Tax=Halothermothrix orenii (strain H 168 / OCM 544 / DSM 9562) TaxID=373903 RepID=B8CZI4_HALOH|nr:homoserine O-acetyltransferase [Halothermothrix orenii]ACL70703.1 homoserine O-acetyltransferase [Halothermothrix orenii H 168]
MSFSALNEPGQSGIGEVSPAKILIKEGLTLENGEKLKPVTITYECYGRLNSKRNNVILVVHHLTADAHVAGYYPHEDRYGWWDDLIGPGQIIDTDRYFVICSNILGSCYGTTGPCSINPETGEPYGPDFPVITVKDMVKAQFKLLRKLGIKGIDTVIGGSLGGMQALRWGVDYPELVRQVVAISAPARLRAREIAYNTIASRAIKNDPDWQGGRYYNTGRYPVKGLQLARMVGMLTYRTPDLFQERFGRKMKNREFEVNNYLEYQGQKFTGRFDANSLLCLNKAMDLFDLARGYSSLEEAISRIKAKTLIITTDTDQLFDPGESVEIVEIMLKQGKKAYHREIKSRYGHDAFLIEFRKLAKILNNWFS